LKLSLLGNGISSARLFGRCTWLVRGGNLSAGIFSSQIKLLPRVLQLPVSLAHIGLVLDEV
jgi:hypothetical protein